MFYADSTDSGHPYLKPAGSLYSGFGKRMLDICLAVAALPLFLPLIAVLAVAVRRDGGPGFFAHTRVGRDGRPFRCWKLRSMVPDAETRLDQHLRRNPGAAREWIRTFKLANDPRITPLGGFLRRTSLDELPQVWNVLKGDMSLVGPRPVTAAELPYYGAERPCYLTHRPGLTGMWQVHGRGDASYARRVKLDRLYHHRVSLGTDLGLLLRTFFCVLGATGR